MLLQSLFTDAIERASAGEEGGCGFQWYVYSYQAGYLLRRAAFMLDKAGAGLWSVLTAPMCEAYPSCSCQTRSSSLTVTEVLGYAWLLVCQGI